ncbi:MAG: thiamine pyrophosphate-binding protein [Candidatus Zixiibacteriota bacterium]
MNRSRISGASAFCVIMERLGIDTVFGLPGTQNIDLYEALRNSSIRTVLATSETSAAFMANGYYRSSGRTAAILTIPGPGFAYAVPGLAEAKHDSAAMVHIVVTRDEPLNHKFKLHALDIEAIACPIVKKTFVIDTAASIEPILTQAYTEAVTGEPGPVVVIIDRLSLLDKIDVPGESSPDTIGNKSATDGQVDEVADIIAQSDAVAILAGQGAADAATQIVRLAEMLESPVITTCSGRGLIPESHRLSFDIDYSIGGVEHVNKLFGKCDLILAIGCKFSHNGTAGFALDIPQSKLVHVDVSVEVLASKNYPSKMEIHSDAKTFIEMLLARAESFSDRSRGFANFGKMKTNVRIERTNRLKHEPKIDGAETEGLSRFFEVINELASRETIIVTDAGLHQTLTRNYLIVERPRGLVVPSDMQSMGFGLPAAIGAGLANPDKKILAIVGDGCFRISAMELTTAVREGIDLTLVLFSDTVLGSIRFQQLASFGQEHAVRVGPVDYADLSRSLGVAYFCLQGSPEQVIEKCVSTPGVKLLEVKLKDSAALQKMQRKAIIREKISNSPVANVIKGIKNRLKLD